MQTKGISQAAKNLGGIISKNSPTILTGLAVCGLVTTVIFAVRATPRAIEILDQYQNERCSDCMSIRGDKACEHCVDYSLTKKEVVKLTWKLYIPAAAMGTVTIACIISSNSINQRRNAALATVYGLTETAFREYKEKVVETIGKNKELKVRDDICADDIAKNPPSNGTIIFTGNGSVLCKDRPTGRYFRSDIEKIRQSVNELNEQMMNGIERWISVNDLYDELDLEHIPDGNKMGWDIDGGTIKISYSSQLTQDGEPCLTLDYEARPRYLK